MQGQGVGQGTARTGVVWGAVRRGPGVRPASRSGDSRRVTRRFLSLLTDSDGSTGPTPPRGGKARGSWPHPRTEAGLSSWHRMERDDLSRRNKTKSQPRAAWLWPGSWAGSCAQPSHSNAHGGLAPSGIPRSPGPRLHSLPLPPLAQKEWPLPASRSMHPSPQSAYRRSAPLAQPSTHHPGPWGLPPQEVARCLRAPPSPKLALPPGIFSAPQGLTDQWPHSASYQSPTSPPPRPEGGGTQVGLGSKSVTD